MVVLWAASNRAVGTTIITGSSRVAILFLMCGPKGRWPLVADHLRLFLYQLMANFEQRPSVKLEIRRLKNAHASDGGQLPTRPNQR